VRYLTAAVLAGALTPGAAAHAAEATEVEALKARADALFEGGHDDSAFALLEEAVRNEPGSMELGNLYRGAIRKRAQEERAINFLKKIVADNPGVEDGAYYNLAFAYIDKIPRVGPMGAGFLSKRSIALFQEVIKRKPDDWIANYGVGMNYLHWPDYFKKNDSATGYLEKCLALQAGMPAKPYFILTYLRLGDAYARLGDAEHAIATWKAGLAQFPGHADLVARVETPADQVQAAVNAFYNPNQAIGEIDTDVSVLWATTVPASAVPLKRPETKKAGIGGQLSAGGANLSDSDLGLFSWFLRNLPFLSDKKRYASVDMSALGVQRQGGDAKLANEIAHGMIEGFVSVMNDDTAERIAERTRQMDGFERPFYHEGLGMGMAAALDAEAAASFEGFAKEIARIDRNFNRLHLAGAGMWFGLESSRGLDTVIRAFDWLGPFGAAYAYEGYGFAQVLFHIKTNPLVLELGTKLPPLHAHSFYHGAGRAFWILGGDDPAALTSRIELVPAAYRGDAYSGFGMGIAFTRVDRPAALGDFLAKAGDAVDVTEVATGAVMGYTIRDLGDAAYVEALTAKGACWLPEVLGAGRATLKGIESAGGDLHANWRNKIREQIPNTAFFKSRMRCTS
jgi:hypothetical protein